MKYLLQFILLLIVSANLNAQPWIQIGQDIDGEAAEDYSRSVSVSADLAPNYNHNINVSEDGSFADRKRSSAKL